MKIEASVLQLSASHEASQSRSLSAESRITFRQMLGGLAEEKTETDLHERVRKLLESLIERIIAALEGRTVREQNPLFAITAEGREILVPAAEEMISALDIDAREITFVLPEGLLDLYL